MTVFEFICAQALAGAAHWSPPLAPGLVTMFLVMVCPQSSPAH